MIKPDGPALTFMADALWIHIPLWINSGRILRRVKAGVILDEFSLKRLRRLGFISFSVFSK
jgi:hypothetical protein